MVAKVISGKNIRGVLNYNENKVKEGLAECILAGNFGGDPKELSFSNKLNRFEKLIAHNSKTRTNAIHISLNFDRSENHSKDMLSAIAIQYMDMIRFADQPYLVYQHKDAAHPHIHIVTTNIRSSGERIDIHNIGRNESEKARKLIERDFNLVKAQSKGRAAEHTIKPVEPQVAVYGKTETKRTISNTVRYVARAYRFTSIPELNAVLRQFNITADTGKAGTRMNEKKGLLFWLLDKNGNKIGVPIKASSIAGSPTLKFLEKQFKLNEALRSSGKERIKNILEGALHQKNVVTISSFKAHIRKEGIHLVVRENEEGRIYGFTFIDNKAKNVFNGSDLGKSYSANHLLEKLKADPRKDSIDPPGRFDIDFRPEKLFAAEEAAKVLEDLTTARQYDFSPSPQLGRKRRRKRKGKSL